MSECRWWVCSRSRVWTNFRVIKRNATLCTTLVAMKLRAIYHWIIKFDFIAWTLECLAFWCWISWFSLSLKWMKMRIKVTHCDASTTHILWRILKCQFMAALGCCHLIKLFCNHYTSARSSSSFKWRFFMQIHFSIFAALMHKSAAIIMNQFIIIRFVQWSAEKSSGMKLSEWFDGDLL